MTQQFKPGDICVIISTKHPDGARNLGKLVEFICSGSDIGLPHDCQVRALEPIWGWLGQSRALSQHPAGTVIQHITSYLRLLRDPDAELPAPPVEKEIKT